ncbi:HNH endonuclease [Micromonospora sp. WMMD737]|uniref:HNH endonuclease n=1 Tax=Micromonospora sp. WMMD737 TaxID=3404113 RepID=UPI003B933303
MSAKRRAALAATGNRNPWSTLTVRSTLNRSAALDRKPAVRAARPAADTGPDTATVHIVLRRDQGCCVRCGAELHGRRGRDWSVQHRRARGAGGTRRPDTNQAHNLILLCGSATTGCHGWVESNRDAARHGGWAIRQPDNPALMPVDHALHGRVWLDADGGWSGQAPAVAS